MVGEKAREISYKRISLQRTLFSFSTETSFGAASKTVIPLHQLTILLALNLFQVVLRLYDHFHTE